MAERADEYRSIWTWLRELEFRQGWCDAGGIRTRFAEAGDPAAPGVLLLHGTGGHWETFAPNLGPLAEHFHCVAVDMVGNGFSEKPDYDYEIPVYVRQLLAVLDHFGMDRTSVVGMSLGAWVAARLALDAPERVEKVVLMSPAGLVATASNMARIRAERTRAVNDPDWDSIKAMFDHLIADERNRIPDVIALRQAIYRLADTRETIDHLLILQDPDARERNLLSAEEWSSIKQPTLVVASGKDYSEYSNTARRVAALLPNSQLLEMPDVKHWPHFEDPDVFNPAALKFLRG
ncbi:alpha/beta fold hydrolase [Amycolatopsis thermoflava]|uniref:alpha/beta fold hydrolase n=1 Tax=Amycolatopsis thermoflava TaxID=84480 RepID=UPI003818F261